MGGRKVWDSGQRAGVEPRQCPCDLEEVALRILRTSGGSVMIAMTLISDPHRGQSKGLSQLRASAPAGQGLPPQGEERQAALDTPSIGVGAESAGRFAGRESRQPAGATRARWGQLCHCALHREKQSRSNGMYLTPLTMFLECVKPSPRS